MKKCFGFELVAISLIVAMIDATVAFCGDAYYKPEEAIRAYIDGYLEPIMDVNRVFTADSTFFKEITSRMSQAPASFRDEEYGKAKKEIEQRLANIEESKSKGLFIFDNALRINENGGHLLCSILYGKMKYKILEIRDGKVPWTNSLRKEAFLELTYDSPQIAPITVDKKKIKKAVVKIVFSEWKIDKKTNYKIDHYEPTRYGLEYF